MHDIALWKPVNLPQAEIGVATINVNHLHAQRRLDLSIKVHMSTAVKMFYKTSSTAEQ